MSTTTRATTTTATTSSSDGGGVGLRRRRRGLVNAIMAKTSNGRDEVEESSPSSSDTPSPPPPYDPPTYETWDDIVSSASVVNGIDAATSRVAPPSSPTLIGTLKLVARFWRWNLPLVLKAMVGLGAVHVALSYYQIMRNGGGNGNGNGNGGGEEDVDSFPIHILHSIAGGVRRVSMKDTLGLSDSNEISTFGIAKILLGLTVKFTIATFVLLFIRICQRLSWRTTEFGTYPNVKDDESSTYQNDELLDVAWSRGYDSCGWHDPTKESVSDSSSTRVMFQTREGYCGMASFNSVLRTFLDPSRSNGDDEDDEDGGAAAGTTDGGVHDYDPYVRLHSLPRYVTLEDAHKFFLEKIIVGGPNSIWNRDDDSSSPATTTTRTPIVSVEMVGGGERGFTSHAAFVRALKQMNHPTQPARILAIYGRSPLFFCDGTGVWGGTLKKILTFGMGHWSPIVSYLPSEDLVLVMDVNRKYGPRGYLIPSKRMYDAVNTRCVMTGNYRGLILLRGPPRQENSGSGDNDSTGRTGTSNATKALITDPTELSRAFGDMKEAYYRHIATSGGKDGGPGERSFTVDEVIDGADDETDSDSDGRRCVRWVTLRGEDEEEPDHRGGGGDDDDSSSSTRDGRGGGPSSRDDGLRAVLSLHPMTFTNTCFLPRRWQKCRDGSDATTGEISSKSLERDLRKMMGAFEALRVPMTVSVRGCPDRDTYDTIHRALCSAGLVPATKRGRTKFFYLNLLPEDGGGGHRDLDSCRPPDGFEIVELRTASTSERDADLIRQWGHVVADSYGFKSSLIRHGRTPGQFLGDAYQVVTHGENLRQFVCIEKKGTDRKVVACSTLYRNPNVDRRVACMFNVCVLPEYRGMKLGRIMSSCVIAEAANAGCTQVVLEASPKGRPVYERLGFVSSEEEGLGGMYVRIGIATESWRWRVLFKILETAMWIKNR